MFLKILLSFTLLFLGSGLAQITIRGSSGPTGAAGGDLSGTYPDPTVAQLNGVAASGYARIAVLNNFTASQYIKGTATSVLTGSIDATASTAVVGVGTLFTTELIVGDQITVQTETRLVTVITDNTNLTVDRAFTNLANDTSVDKLPAIQSWRTSGNALTGAVTDIGYTFLGVTGVGYVGIGTTNPSAKLHLSGTAADVKIKIDTITSGDPFIYFLRTSEAEWSIGLDDSDSNKFKIDAAAALGSTAALTIEQTGNVGINTTIPLHKLTTVGGSAAVYGAYTATDYYGGTVTSTDGALTITATTLGTGSDNQNVAFVSAGTGYVSANTGIVGSGSIPAVATCGTIGTGSKNAAGFITSTVTGSCVAVLTFATVAAPVGWSCAITNATTANLVTQTGSSTTTATFTGTTVTGDILRYACSGY